MAIICRNNPELGKGQAADFNRRLEQSVELDRNGRPVDGRPFLFSVDWLRTLEFVLLIPFSNILDFLL